ncbi:HNH endonuclease [Vibrio parahaemolyticus]|uniref:HNH endonuclease n=1 Tax=Vibrio parahaemolyticus TaxID=670 RepID=UPI00329882A1
MKIIAIPDMSESYVLDKCVSGIGIKELRDRISEVSTNIISDGQLYKQKAELNELHTLTPVNIGDDELALGRVTKKELTSLYTNYLVGKKKPGREIYDALMTLTPLCRCPYCGLSHVSTLDHFLPKTKYPSLSVTPTNLVPSCKDCNTGKSSTVALTGGSQPLHPYFDREPFHTEQWLFAKVIDNKPITVTYEVSPPSDWSPENKSRVEAHFNEFELCLRYAIEAANELATQENTFNNYIVNQEYDSLITVLEERYFSYERSDINSWQTALYHALLEFYRHKFAPPRQTRRIETDSEIESCPRCLGKMRLLGTSCDACNGVGIATASHFRSLGDSVYDPVICECPDGFLSCRICRGTGKVDLERARSIVVE